jgi:hypothetical protein
MVASCRRYAGEAEIDHFQGIDCFRVASILQSPGQGLARLAEANKASANAPTSKPVAARCRDDLALPMFLPHGVRGPRRPFTV